MFGIIISEQTFTNIYLEIDMKDRYELKIRRNRLRRRRQLLKRALITLMSMIALSFLITMMFSVKVKASEQDEVHYFKYYKSEVVSAKDTLWDYAVIYSRDEDYQNYINEVKRMNHLESDDLVIGMNIILPYYSTEYVE